MAEEQEQEQEEEEQSRGREEEEQDRNNDNILSSLQKTRSVARDLRAFYEKSSDSNRIGKCVADLQRYTDDLSQNRARMQAFILGLQEEVDLTKQRLETFEAGPSLDEEILVLRNNLTKLRDQSEEWEEVARGIEEQLNLGKEQEIEYQNRKEKLQKIQAFQKRVHNELSLYAQISRIIPDLDEPHTISGRIVNKQGKIIQSFELHPKSMSSFELCQALWDKSA